MNDQTTNGSEERFPECRKLAEINRSHAGSEVRRFIKWLREGELFDPVMVNQRYREDEDMFFDFYGLDKDKIVAERLEIIDDVVNGDTGL